MHRRWGAVSRPAGVEHTAAVESAERAPRLGRGHPRRGGSAMERAVASRRVCSRRTTSTDRRWARVRANGTAPNRARDRTSGRPATVARTPPGSRLRPAAAADHPDHQTPHDRRQQVVDARESDSLTARGGTAQRRTRAHRERGSDGSEGAVAPSAVTASVRSCRALPGLPLRRRIATPWWPDRVRRHPPKTRSAPACEPRRVNRSSAATVRSTRRGRTLLGPLVLALALVCVSCPAPGTPTGSPAGVAPSTPSGSGSGATSRATSS